MNPGDKIKWRTVNGFAHGTLIRPLEDTKVWAVKMANDKYMPVHENSMIPDTNE